MHRYAYLAVLFFAACNTPTPQHQEVVQQTSGPVAEEMPFVDTATTQQETTPYVDSFRIEMDSLMKARITLPPIYANEILNANDEATKKFGDLSTASHGTMKVLVNSSLVAQQVQQTLNRTTVANSDLLLLIDHTTSMTDDIENVKQGLAQIMDTIRKYKGTRLAIATYGDSTADGMGWYTFKDFGTDYDQAAEYVAKIQVWGGGHYWEESVYEAIMRSLDEPFWQSERKRNIILIGDAPPFERPMSSWSINDVIHKVKESRIVMNFYPIVITPTVQNARMTPEEIAKYKPLKLTTALYPNPTKGHIDVGFEETGTYHMELYNVAGELVSRSETYGISWGADLGDIPDGTYILRVINQDHQFEVLKFVLQR